ncbi:MAG: putative sulfate exporter family transporter [Rhodospirillaceae bacterium]|nr:putative sulfate exporter family transporter [Rhodospirillaceae bacterium]
MSDKPDNSTKDSDVGAIGFRDRLTAQGKILFPGLLATVTVAIAARFLSEHYGGPTMLFALLLGIGFHFLSEEGPCIPGIEFASQAILKFGVALLGLGITIEQISQSGWITIGIVVGGVFVTMVSGPVIARFIGRGWRLGCLTGGAVAICGASAALAIASVLPKNEHSERNTLFTVISVTTLSTFAMILYPMIVDLLKLDDLSAGIFIGATIHDVAQVVGAGYSISEEAGDTATFVKLLRVAMLVPIVLLLSFLFRNHGGSGAGRQLPIPFFVFGFVLLVGLGSAEWFPPALKSGLLDLSRWCLVIAIAAIGMKTALRSLKGVGGQAITLICVETVLLAGLVIGVLMIAKP